MKAIVQHELVSVPEDALALKPATITSEQAAAETLDSP
jgi:hypothetical protein